MLTWATNKLLVGLPALESIYQYYLGLTAFPFLLVVLLLAITSLATISSQLLKVVKESQAENLRDD